MPNAELGKQRVDRADLHAGLAAGVAHGCGVDVVIPIGLNQRQGGEAFDDLRPRLGTRETLQQFLQDKSRRDDDLRTQQGLREFLHLWPGGLDVTAKRQRPNAGIDQKAH